MTPGQCRAARALLRLTQAKLAKASGLGLSTIQDFELSRRIVSDDAIAAMLGALEARGVRFGKGAVSFNVRRHPRPK